MNKIRNYILCIVLLVTSCSIEGEKKSGLLWKITTARGNESFVYGTMHVYPQDRLTISKKVISTLKTCKVLAIERNIKDDVDQKLFLQGDKHKADARIYQIISDRYNLHNMEAELLSVANSNNISITGLETAKEVLTLSDQVPIQDRSESDEQIIESFERMIAVYQGELIDYFADELIDKEFGRETRKLMVDQRNLNWLDDIENLIKEDRTFIAVGMGHLGGEKGLLNLIKKQGYKLERVKI